ncbi:MAG: hypothetical protein WAM72_07080, partial [Xanthobacteraceae bacterium]
MLRTRNSWHRLSPNPNRRTTDSFEPQRVFQADDSRENTQDEQRKPHGGSPARLHPRDTNSFKHDWPIGALIRIKSQARRITANIAKLPELLRQPK